MIEVLDTYRKSEDLIKIGAYVKGTNKKTDYAVTMIEKINTFLQQNKSDKVTFEQCVAGMKALVSQ
jgi:flagellum-specific ATP synthase